MKYESLVNGIVTYVGGLENISHASHCATRLRFKLKDMSKLDTESLEKVSGVLGVRVQSGIELQIIVGTDVLNIFEEFIKITGYKTEGNVAESVKTEKEKLTLQGIGMAIMNYLSGTVAPVIPIYLGCGMLMAVLNICTAFFGVSSENGTVVILNAAANAGFYFMPIVLGWTACSKLGADPALGALLGMTLLYSGINGVEGLNFLGISVYPCTYNGTFLPIILGAAFLSLIYKFFKDKIPQSVRYFLLPLVTLLISIPVTLLVLGPAGYVAGTWVSVFFEWLGSHVKILAISLWSFICPVAVMTGMDKAVFFLNMSHLNEVGFDNIFLPGGLAGNSAIGGAALAVWYMSKDKETKSLGASSGITAILGITEPALYGICVKLKTPLLGAMLGAAVGGAFAGIVNLKQYVYAGPGLMTSAVYISADGSMFNFVMCLVTIAVSAIAAFAITYMLCGRGEKLANSSASTSNVSTEVDVLETVNTIGEGKEVMVSAAAEGTVLRMEQIPDQVFSKGLLGPCCAIEPKIGNVYAPVDGTIAMVTDTLHAIGVKSDDGVEILLHIGIDTVDMNGDGFSCKVKEGQRVQKGQLLVTMDLDKIKAAGHSAAVIHIVSNGDDYSAVNLVADGSVRVSKDLMSIRL